MLVGAKKKNSAIVPKQRKTKQSKSRSAFRFFLPLAASICIIKSILFPSSISAQEKADTLFFDGSKVRILTNYQDTTIDFSSCLLQEFGYKKFPGSAKYAKIYFEEGKPEFDIFAPNSRVLSVFVHGETGLYTSGNLGISYLPDDPKCFEITANGTKGLYFTTPRTVIMSLPDGGYELLLGKSVKYPIGRDATISLGFHQEWKTFCIELDNQPSWKKLLHFMPPSLDNPQVKLRSVDPSSPEEKTVRVKL